MTSVGIIEDDAQIRTLLQQYLNRQDKMVCTLACGSVESFRRQLTAENLPDVLLMDIGLPGMSGIEGMKLIRHDYPDVDIIMLTVYNDADKIFQSLCAGATGYLLKNTPLDEIKEGIELLKKGGSPMSPQIARKVVEFFSTEPKPKDSGLSDKEKEIVIGLVDGLSYKLIADRMCISIETVRFHIKNIYRKLHVHSKAEVISKSLKGEI